jgi:hypothetical protein
MVTVLVTSALTTVIDYAVISSPSRFSQSSEIVRFYKPEVLEGNQIGYASVDLGTWTPLYSDNAIINAIFYFQYLTPENTSSIRFGLVISPGGAQINDMLASSSRTEYSQSKAYVCPLPNPNSANYIVNFGFYNHDTSTPNANTSSPPVPIPTYVKELNVILQVVDGLAPS